MESIAKMGNVPKASKLSDQLREAVRTSRVSRYRLSKELGISQATLSRFVNGERGLSWEAADAIAKHLGLQLAASERRRKSDP